MVYARHRTRHALLTLGAAVAALLGCSSSPPSATPDPQDSGADVVSGPDVGGPASDAGAKDAIANSDGAKPSDAATDGPPRTDEKDAGPVRDLRIRMVHGASGLGAVRLCVWNSATRFGTLETPLPDVQQAPGGLPFGGVAPLSIAPLTLAAFPALAVTFYSVPADVPSTARCSELIPGAGTTPPAEPAAGGIHKLGTLSGPPTAAFNAGKSHLIAILGCNAGQGTDDVAKAKCGPAYDGTSNLRIEMLELQEPPNFADKIAVQFIQLSPHLHALSPTGVIAAFVVPTQPSDGGADADPVGDAGAGGPTILEFGDAASFPATNTAPVTSVPARSKQLSGVFEDRGATRFQAYGAGPGGARGVSLIAAGGLSLATIEMATLGRAGQFLANNQTFTFISLGDPSQAAETAEGFRVVATPNQ